MLTRMVLCAVAGLVFSIPASAQSPAPPGTPLALPVPLPKDFRAAPYGADREPVCTPVYLNESFGSGYYLPAGAGVEIADDLHTTLGAPEALCAIDFGYFKPGTDFVNATLRIYDNTPADGAPGALLAGPYLLAELPPGLNAFHVELPGGMVGSNLWLGVSFSDDDTGLLLFSPPTLGASHDVLWQTPPGGSGAPGSMNGNPPANLFLGVHASTSTPALGSSWGRLKSHYR